MRDRRDILMKALESFPGVRVVSMTGSILNGVETITVLAHQNSFPQKLLEAAHASRGNYSFQQNIEPIDVLGRFDVAEHIVSEPTVEIKLNIGPGFYKVLGEEVDKQVFKEMDAEANVFIEQWLSEDDKA